MRQEPLAISSRVKEEDRAAQNPEHERESDEERRTNGTVTVRLEKETIGVGRFSAPRYTLAKRDAMENSTKHNGTWKQSRFEPLLSVWGIPE
ncbi:membrane protein [Anopheles sinensis]|uniref:Membrane protein n=1 Tax=Anopheles sinensis TaxID=74873 RepID=A0A084W2D5_ANOSI|nr:membrane protein [Anopheles sinensis]